MKTPLGLCTKLSYSKMGDQELIELTASGDPEALSIATTRGLFKLNAPPRQDPA